MNERTSGADIAPCYAVSSFVPGAPFHCFYWPEQGHAERESVTHGMPDAAALQALSLPVRHPEHLHWQDHARWVVLEIKPGNLLEEDGFVEFQRGKVIFNGKPREGCAFLRNRGLPVPSSINLHAGGDWDTIVAPDYGVALDTSLVVRPRGAFMACAFSSFLLTMLLCVTPALGEKKEEKPQSKPAPPSEKIDGKADRSLTGFVENIDATDDNKGSLTLRTSGAPTLYELQISEKTKILTAKGDLLERGLKSPLLARAEIRVTFTDRQPKGDKANRPDAHVCRIVQLMKGGVGENAKDKKVGPVSKTINATKLAAAFAKDPKKASRDFSPMTGRPILRITGRVRRVTKGQAILSNADAEVRVYVSLGDKKAEIGDLIEVTAKRIRYDSLTKKLVVETDSVKISPENSGIDRIKRVR